MKIKYVKLEYQGSEVNKLIEEGWEVKGELIFENQCFVKLINKASPAG
jgi:hypothetical protein